MHGGIVPRVPGWCAGRHASPRFARFLRKVVGRYGRPKITATLRHAGERIAQKTVARLATFLSQIQVLVKILRIQFYYSFLLDMLDRSLPNLYPNLLHFPQLP